MTSLKQLRYLNALAAAGHFGRAAENAGISQPALSMQIRELERTLGAPLVERTAAGARLTELGTDVAARATQILAAVRDLEDLAFARGAILAGPLRLGIIPSIAPFLLPRLLDAAGARYPGLRLTVRETVTRSLVDELVAGELDAIVASLPLGNPELTEAAAFDDPFLLAALADLISAEELLLLEDGHCLRDQALEVCAAIDPRRLRSFGATSLATLLQLVAAGHGITLLPQLAVAAGASPDNRVNIVRFADPEPRRTVAVAWRKSSPRERDFRALAELVREAGTNGGGGSA
jgi:LysR family hydrogen peroxide-inducible transcriptional activator